MGKPPTLVATFGARCRDCTKPLRVRVPQNHVGANPAPKHVRCRDCRTITECPEITSEVNND